MVPSTWLSLITFAFLIAPGVLYDFLAKQRRISVQQPAFLETSRIVFSSMFFTSLGIVAVSVIGIFEPHWILNLPKFFSYSHKEFTDHFWLALKSIGLVELVALGLVIIEHFCMAGKAGINWRLYAVSPWEGVFSQNLPKDSLTYATVYVKGGNHFEGYVTNYTADLEMANREIVLGSDNPDWSRVILSADVIERIEVTRMSKEPKDPKASKFLSRIFPWVITKRRKT